jgi:hypothetical protein
LRKARILAVALIAALGITAVAFAQSNEYTVSGKTNPTGGTKKKPKAIQLSFGFQTTRADGTLPSPIQKYSIGFEGAQVYTKVVKKKCTAAAMNAAASDSGCPSRAKVGSGVVEALAGTAGQPLSEAAPCKLNLTLYNSGGNHMALWLKGTPPTCIADISRAIDATFVKKGNGTALEFEVPEDLRHVLGLDVAVVNVTSTIKKISGKVGKKKVGFFSSVGCKDKKRDITVTFTDETGAAVPVKRTLPKC